MSTHLTRQRDAALGELRLQACLIPSPGGFVPLGRCAEAKGRDRPAMTVGAVHIGPVDRGGVMGHGVAGIQFDGRRIRLPGIKTSESLAKPEHTAGDVRQDPLFVRTARVPQTAVVAVHRVERDPEGTTVVRRTTPVESILVWRGGI